VSFAALLATDLGSDTFNRTSALDLRREFRCIQRQLGLRLPGGQELAELRWANLAHLAVLPEA